MLTMEKLREFSPEADEGLARCIGNESFYFKLIGMAVDEPSFGSLKEAVESGDYGKAFEEAHKLKGVLGNLSLTPLLDPASKLTEMLRPAQPCDCGSLLDELLEKRGELSELINS